jgi:flagellar hook-length control protein FliK
LPVAIAARAQAGSHQFDIRLDPPELGRIEVRLDVDRNGQVTSHITVDRADTLQLLQSQQPQLERALEQAGLKTADNGLQFTLRDQSFAGQNGQNGNGAGTQASAPPLAAADADQPIIPTAQAYSRIGRASGIDIRV